MIIVHQQGNGKDFYIGIFDNIEKFIELATECKKDKYHFEIKHNCDNLEINHYIENFLFDKRKFVWKKVKINEFNWFKNGTKNKFG
jgi:hypothetical protein